MTIRDIIAAQSAAIEPEAFQGAIVEGMTRALLRDAAPPCLLRAPTGSGKTFIYLANAEAQRGFEAAVQASQAVKSQLEGQTEKLLVRQTESGAVVYTNRATSQSPLDYGLPLPQSSDLPVREPVTQQAYGMQQSLFENFFGADNPANALDEVLAAPAQVRKKPHEQPDTEAELLELLNSKGIRAYPLHKNIRNLPRALKREQHPQMQEMTKVSEAVAMRLPIPEDLKRNAVRAALNRLKEKEVHSELTQGARYEEEVLMITDRSALAREAIGILRNLPQVEDEDVRIIVEVLGSRLRSLIEEAFEDREDRPPETGLRRLSRDAAYWVIRREAQNITELMQSLVAEFTTLEAAAPLPDWMVFPAALSLAASSRNIYGVMPPSEDDLAKIEASLMVDERKWLDERKLVLEDGELSIGKYDNALKLNGEEREFARALDRADFVAWWHRNPDRKHYSVSLVRGDHQNYFYPDFVVCLSHLPHPIPEGTTSHSTKLPNNASQVAGYLPKGEGNEVSLRELLVDDEPMIRLIETKENTKDAARKARRIPKCYGKVLFHTKDQSRLRVVNDDGSLGETVEWDDLAPVQEWLRASRPVVQP